MASGIIERLQLGKVPRVVGTIITADYLQAWAANPRPLPCDLVELRVDGFSDFPNWIAVGQQIEKSGTPVFATIRHAREGGKWNGDESKRQQMLQSALASLTGIDVELSSEIAEPLGERARALGKLCILSFHDFQKTPLRAELLQMLRRMHQLGAIGKIAATANSPEDVETLRSLLREPWPAPVCIIGMGSHGRETRLRFPLEGSCFTYGYLDTPGAPGQFSAQELTQHFQSAGTPS